MTDLLLDDTGDIKITNDDLVIGFSDQQQQQRLLLTEKGNIKQFPLAGVGSQTYLESEDEAGFIREVGLQFTADGMTVKKLEYKKPVLNIYAPYE